MSALNLCSFEDFRYHASLKPSAHLMVILHGRGDSRLGLEFLRHGLKLDSMHYLLINAPDPWPIPFGAPGYSWYEMAPNQGPGIARSLLLLNQLTEELESQGFDRSNIIMCGFSQGCVMSLETVLRSSRPFFGVIGISGFFYQPEALMSDLRPAVQQTPILLTHGYSDEVLPFEITKDQVNLVACSLPNLEFHGLAKGHTIINFEFGLIQEWYHRVARSRKRSVGELG